MRGAVRIGFNSMNTDRDPAPDVLATALAERRFDSLWFGEHTHIPVSRRSAYPAGGELPDAYRRMMDPFVSLAFAATAAPGLRLGTAVCLALQHDPVVLAKQVATLDRLSAGRLTLGVGVGWNREELATHRHVERGRHFDVLGEVVHVLRTIWRDEQSAFSGEFVDLQPCWSFPKPAQPGGPRIALGSRSPRGIRAAAAWADIWMPVAFGVESVTGLLGDFDRALRAAGRRRDEIAVQLLCADDPGYDDLQRYRDLGIRLVVVGPGREFSPRPGPLEDYLDRYAALIDRTV